LNYIFVARHGGTTANQSEINAGPLDTPLSKKGRKQIAYLAKELKKTKIAAVYSSPVFRAVETAKMLAKPHGLKVKTLEDLTEAKLKPRFVGKKGRKHILTDPEAFEETYEELQRRVVRALEKIRKGEKGNVLVVSHGNPIGSLLDYVTQRNLAGKNYYVLHPDTGSLSIIESADKPSVVLFNYHRKLFDNY
jgi:broad specificity phosphatase PhoE